MRCPICGRENPEGNAYCIFCGAPLTAGAPAQRPTGTAAGMSSLAELTGQVQALRQILLYYAARMASVEGVLGIDPPPPVDRAQAAAPSAAQPQEGTHAATAVLYGVPPTEAAPAAPPPVHGPGWQQAGQWEQVLGGNWLAIVGGLAVLVGVGFFLKLAFDSNWIGPTGRVVLGVVAGVGFLTAGERYARRYGVWAQAMTAAGVGILYLAIFAALVLYELIGVYPAFAFLALVTLVSGVAALRYEAPVLAALSVVGGMATPFMLVGELPDRLILIPYIGLLDVGIVGLASFRNWRSLTLLGFLGSLYWFSRAAFAASPLVGEGFLAIHFLLFVGATTLFHLIWQRRPNALDFGLMTLNAGTFFLISVGRLWAPEREWLGLFTVGLAGFYAALAFWAVSLNRRNVYVVLFMGGIAAVFLTVAIPVQFQGPIVPIAWAAEGVVLMALGARLASFPTRVSSLLVLTATVGWLLLVEMDVNLRQFRPLLNGRFAAFAGGIAAIYLAGLLLWRARSQLRYEEERAWVLPGLLLAANLLTLWILSWELINYVDSQPRAFGGFAPQAKGFGLSALWAAYAIVAVVDGIVRRVRLVRLGGLALFWITIFKVFVVDSFELTQGYRVASFIILGALLLATGYLYQRYRRVIRGFLLE